MAVLRVRAHGLGTPGWSMQVLARAKYDLARICLITLSGVGCLFSGDNLTCPKLAYERGHDSAAHNGGIPSTSLKSVAEARETADRRSRKLSMNQPTRARGGASARVALWPWPHGLPGPVDSRSRTTSAISPMGLGSVPWISALGQVQERCVDDEMKLHGTGPP